MIWRYIRRWYDKVTGIEELRTRVIALEEEVIFGRTVYEEQLRQTSYQTARNKLKCTILAGNTKKQ
jgi:hypothetical protein